MGAPGQYVRPRTTKRRDDVDGRSQMKGNFKPMISTNGRFRRVSPVAPRPREGPLTEPTAGVQPWPRERVLMPQSRRSG